MSSEVASLERLALLPQAVVENHWMSAFIGILNKKVIVPTSVRWRRHDALSHDV